MMKALPNTSFLPVPKSAPAGHTTAAAHLLWQVFPRYPCLEYKDNSGQSCSVRYTWTASFGRGLMFWQKWFNLTPQFVAYQLSGHLLHPHWYFTAYSSICQVLLGALRGIALSWKNVFTRPMLILEAIAIPIVMRSASIAEELSASAVTRGIDNPAQRTSFIQLKVHAKDWMVFEVHPFREIKR